MKKKYISLDRLQRLHKFGVNLILRKMFSKLLSKKKPSVAFMPPKYAMFNVDIFNKWFNDKDNRAIYAHSGIFLRLDKLSESHIRDYLLKCHNVKSSDFNLDEDIYHFYYEIRENWLNKINHH